MDAARQSGYYTIDDIYHLPEGQRAELINGELYMMAAPGTGHQRLVMEISFKIREYWIVDQEKSRITVYNFEHDTMEEYSFSDKVRVGIYEEFEIDFSTCLPSI